MTIQSVNELYGGASIEEMDFELQDIGEIHETPVAIPNQ